MGALFSWILDLLTSNCLTFLVASLVILVIVYVFRPGQVNSGPPGPRPWPLIGTYPEIAHTGASHLHEYYRAIQEKYGPVVKLKFGKYDFVVVSGFEAIRETFVEKRVTTSTRASFVPSVEQILRLGKGVLHTDGDLHLANRNALLAGIKATLESSTYENIVLGEIKLLTEAFEEQKNAQFKPDDLLIETAMGCRLGSLLGKRYDHGDPNFLNMFQALMSVINTDASFSPAGTIPLFQIIPGINKKYKIYIKGYSDLHGLLVQEIKERKQTYKGRQSDCVTDVYLREQRTNPNSPFFSDENIASALAESLVGGVSTAAWTIDWVLLYMVAYQNIQKKCQEEIDKVVKHRAVAFSDLDKLHYVSATLHEVQRRETVVFTSAPHVVKEDMTIKGYQVPKDTLLVVHTASSNLDPTQWTEPMVFNPERFLKKDGTQTDLPSAFMPYAVAGNRKCTGYSLVDQELILVFANLLKTFVFSKEGGVNFEGDYRLGVRPLVNELIAKRRV